MSRQAAFLMLLAQARVLGPLHDWPPCGALLDDVMDAARGHGGLSERDVQRLRRWARRWQEVDPRVRAFYEAHAGERCVGPALWRILEHLGEGPQGAAYGRLVGLFEEKHGHRGSLDLVPHIA